MNKVKEDIKNIEVQLKMSENNEYRLWGMIIHTGDSGKKGHYMCYIKIQYQWFEFSDQNVKKVPDDIVEELKFSGDICTLLYRKPEITISHKMTSGKMTDEMAKKLKL